VQNPVYHTEVVPGLVTNNRTGQMAFGMERTLDAIMRIEAGTPIPIPGGTPTGPAAQNFARDYGRSPASYGNPGGDQAGHIIGQQFGGSGTDLRNIFPIDWDLNDIFAPNPRYTNGENYIAGLVRRGNTVCFRISFTYGSATRPLRPSAILFEIMFRPGNNANAPWTRQNVPIPNGAPIP
jgi:hypothetical protein